MIRLDVMMHTIAYFSVQVDSRNCLDITYKLACSLADEPFTLVLWPDDSLPPEGSEWIYNFRFAGLMRTFGARINTG